MLDNVETLLQARSFEGRYRGGYEGYSLLIQRVAEMAHQSCLLLTSREMLSELEPLEGTQSPVRALKVFGLGWTESQQMLKDKDLFGAPEAWDGLVRHYAGKPLALKLAAATVREVFGGNIAAFLVLDGNRPERTTEASGSDFSPLFSYTYQKWFCLGERRLGMMIPTTSEALFVRRGALVGRWRR